MKVTFTYELEDIERLIKTDLNIKGFKLIKITSETDERFSDFLHINAECEEIPKLTSYRD